MPKTSSSKLLALSKAEEKILETLTELPQIPSLVVKRSGIPNASAYLAMSSLIKRGLAEKRIIDKRTHWTKAESSKLEEVFMNALHGLDHTENIPKLNISHEDTTNITIHRGDTAMRDIILNTFSSIKPNEKVVVFQGSFYDDGWPEIVGKKDIIRLNKFFSENNSIAESIVPVNYFEKLTPLLGRDWAKSYLDRTNILYTIPDKFMPAKGEIILIRDRAIIISAKDRIAVEIKNREILLMIRAMLEFIKTFAKKENISELKKSFT